MSWTYVIFKNVPSIKVKCSLTNNEKKKKKIIQQHTIIKSLGNCIFDFILSNHCSFLTYSEQWIETVGHNDEFLISFFSPQKFKSCTYVTHNCDDSVHGVWTETYSCRDYESTSSSFIYGRFFKIKIKSNHFRAWQRAESRVSSKSRGTTTRWVCTVHARCNARLSLSVGSRLQLLVSRVSRVRGKRTKV